MAVKIEKQVTVPAVVSESRACAEREVTPQAGDEGTPPHLCENEKQ